MKRFSRAGAALLVVAGTFACARSDADATITTQVKSKLESDRIVTNPDKIQVQTEKKVVTLSGRVDSPAVEQQAVQLARSTDGVKKVVDNLSVTPGAAPPSSSSGAPGEKSPPNEPASGRSASEAQTSSASNEPQPTPSARY